MSLAMRFVCTSCQRQFTVSPATRARFPNWTPKTCMKCRSGKVPSDTSAVIFTDSELCVNTISKWAKAWEARGWRKKDGEIKNLELVQELYRLYHGHPGLELRWIKAHNGARWNEYADALATAYRRG
jgi:hypothetical protein